MNTLIKWNDEKIEMNDFFEARNIKKSPISYHQKRNYYREGERGAAKMGLY